LKGFKSRSERLSGLEWPANLLALAWQREEAATTTVWGPLAKVQRLAATLVRHVMAKQAKGMRIISSPSCLGIA
jgi:hypothetical protein